MSRTSVEELESNPFSTRFVRPGVIDYVFAPGESAAKIIERLGAASWRGAIIGPHGSGKSTLLAALRDPLEQAARRPVFVTLHDGQRRLPLALSSCDDLGHSSLLVIDGYEQLSWLSRMRLKLLCRQRGCGLLITGHRSVGLAEVYRTTTSLELARQVVESLLGERNGGISEAELAKSFAGRRGNLREVLFDLYDLYQRRRSLGTCPNRRS